MLRSMTGYGGSDRTDGGRRIRAEVRSVNQRFLDLQIKAPRLFLPVEDRIRRTIESRVARGRVTVFIDWRDENESAAPTVNAAAARRLVDELRKVASDLSLSGDVDVSTLSRFPQVFEQMQDAPGADDLWRSVEPTLSEAVDGLVTMREEEGRKLHEEIARRISVIESIIDSIEKSGPEVTAALKERLTEKIRSLVDGVVAVDEARLAQEVAIAAERADFTEEIVRLAAHTAHARGCLDADEPVGKRLNFLVQEMHREANTIGSKTSDVDVSGAALTLKEEIEKLREQVQNVE